MTPNEACPLNFDRKQSAGFSLVEVVTSMFILALFILAFTKGLTYTKYTAEDNLYEATAMTVAVSTIEQMKGASLNLLESPPKESGKEIFTMIVEGGQEHDIILDEVNVILVPIVTEKDGSIAKKMELEMTPSITPMSSVSGYWLTIRYSYKHPSTGRVRTEVVRNSRSTVPSH
ncbi:type IV pilus modification PilV family protein [Coraliomargarita sp. W4R53]